MSDSTIERRPSSDELSELRRLHSICLVTASLVHDLNNVLTPMLASTTLLLKKLPAGSPEAMLAGELASLTKRASSLSRQILSLGRPRSANLSEVDVSGVIRELRPLIERFVGPDIRVQTSIAGSGCRARVDRERLEHALLNLVANARDAMPGGGEIEISVDIVPSEGQLGHFARIVVTDTGGGMSDEVRARAFEPFFTTRATLGGTGLGLAGVRRFVSDSGGVVSIRSRTGGGTQVILCLPCELEVADTS